MAGIATAFVGILIGLPTLRLRGDYLAIVTLGFGEIMPQVARNGDSLFGTGFNLTNDLQFHRVLLDAIAAGEPEKAKRAFQAAMKDWAEQALHLYSAESEEALAQ